MEIKKQLLEWQGEHSSWRQSLHAHPQTAFEEQYASDFISEKLKSFGIEIERGWAKTGVVGTIKGRSPSSSTIGLRADIDALDINEQTGLAYRSTFPGKMHACGHDGHTTMLLAAARYLASHRDFSGTVKLIFQPAEENEGGGRVMVEEGLFDRHHCDAVFGLHNWPGLPVGSFAVKTGPCMAAFDVFEVQVRGRGSHAAQPHLSIDPVVIASQIVTALQTIVSRQVNPLDQLVITVTQFHAGDTWNVIPESAILRGTVRTFQKSVQDFAESRMRQIIEGVASSFGGVGELRYERRYPATINTERESGWAAQAAVDVANRENVNLDPNPSMGGEDFAFMLQKRPGCYIWMGNGTANGGKQLHSPYYDFNDEAIPVGASYWVRLVERLLPAG